MTAHIALARTEGPKAGFNAYMASHVPTAAARREAIREAGNKKEQFKAYCALFGDQFGPVNGNGAVRAESQIEEVRENGLIARVAKALGVSTKELNSLVNKSEPVEETPEADEPIVATRISWPMCMAVKKIVEAQGLAFAITDKSGGKGTGKLADYTVTVAGRKLTPAKASALIGASKS